MTKEQQETLAKFANLFEPIHQAILKAGVARVTEYSGIWHLYKDEVRPILNIDAPAAG